MMWKKKREIEQDNISASNVCYAGGRGEDISAYLCGEGLPPISSSAVEWRRIGAISPSAPYWMRWWERVR